MSNANTICRECNRALTFCQCTDLNIKDSNPKDSLGIKKVGLHVIPSPVLMEIALALTEGARKYGGHNWRIAGVRYSVYYDACMRHLMAFWEGQDIDPDSGLSHITKAMAGLAVLRDSMLQGNAVDDRPPKTTDQEWIMNCNKKAEEIIAKYPNGKEPYTELNFKDKYEKI